MRHLLLLAFLLAGLAPAFAAEISAPPAPEPQISLGETLPERVMGEVTAPISIIEYASLTCSHCAHFHKEILPKLVEKYIATGKVKLIYRDFPLDGTALKAAQLAHCMPEDRYFPFIKTLFDTQGAWTTAADSDATLTQYAKLAGLPGERVEACLANKTLQEALVARRLEAEKQFSISSTPSFIINYGAETISGASTFEEFEKPLLKYIAKTEKKTPPEKSGAADKKTGK